MCSHQASKQTPKVHVKIFDVADTTKTYRTGRGRTAVGEVWDGGRRRVGRWSSDGGSKDSHSGEGGTAAAGTVTTAAKMLTAARAATAAVD